MAQLTRKKMEKLIKKSKVKSLIKALTYNRGETFAWDKPESGGKFNANYYTALGHIKGHKEWVQHYGVRMDAAKALGEIGDERAVEPLLEVAENDNLFAVRTKAVEALKSLKWQPDTSIAAAVYWIRDCNWDKCVELGEVAVAPLIDAFVWGLPSERIDIGRTLARIGGPAVEALIETLNKWLGEYLGMVGFASREGINPANALGVLLLESFEGMSSLVEKSAWALSETGDERAVEALNSAISTLQVAFAQVGPGLLMSYIRGEFLEKDFNEALTKLKERIATA